MAKLIFIAAFTVETDDFAGPGESVTRDDIAEYLCNLQDDGVRDVIVWSSAADMVSDHVEHGPIDVAYLTDEEPDAETASPVIDPTPEAEIKHLHMIDWQHGPDGDGDATVDNRFWSARLEIAPHNIRLRATAPDGDEREVWIEIANGDLVAHCYDAEHEEPLNVRIGAGSIRTDDDRERKEITHG